MTPMTNATQPLEMSAAISIETTPIATVSSNPMGSRPGWKRRPSAPTTAPTMRNQMKCMAGDSRAVARETARCRPALQPAEQLGLLRLELLVRQDAFVAQLGELPDLLRDLLVGVRLRVELLSAQRVLELLAPLAHPRDADPALRELQRVRPGDRPFLHEPPVRDPEQ